MHQVTPQGVAERLAGGLELLVFVERLARGGRSQAGGVHHAADKERPLGQQAVRVLGDEHVFQVDAVCLPCGFVGRVRQHERHALDTARFGLERDRVEEVGVEHIASVGEACFASFGFGIVLFPPGWLGVDDACLAAGDDRDRVRQVRAVVACRLGDEVGREPVGDIGAGAEEDLGAGFNIGVERPHAVGAVGGAAPLDRRRVALRRAGDDHDLVRHDEARQQPNTELADEVVGFQHAPLRGAADRGEELVDLALGEAGRRRPAR